MNISKLLKVAAIGSAAVLLAACEPSEGDINAAMQKQFKAETAAARAVLGNAIPEMKNVKKIGCKEDGDNAYLCDVEVTVAMRDKEQKKVMPARLVKGSEGWTATP